MLPGIRLNVRQLASFSLVSIIRQQSSVYFPLDAFQKHMRFFNDCASMPGQKAYMPIKTCRIIQNACAEGSALQCIDSYMHIYSRLVFAEKPIYHNHGMMVRCYDKAYSSIFPKQTYGTSQSMQHQKSNHRTNLCCSSTETGSPNTA